MRANFHQGNCGKHSQTLHPRLELRLNPAQKFKDAARGQAPQGNPAGKQIRERHIGRNSLDSPLRKFPFELLSISTEKNPGESAVSTRQWTGRRKFPVRSFRAKRLMMKATVDQGRPLRDPRLDHYDFSANLDTAGGFLEEPPWVLQMVENIGHNNRAERVVRKGQTRTIQYELDPGTGEDIRRDQVGNMFFQETGTGTEFQDRTGSGWNFRGDESVPVFVNQAKQTLFLNKPTGVKQCRMDDLFPVHASMGPLTTFSASLRSLPSFSHSLLHTQTADLKRI